MTSNATMNLRAAWRTFLAISLTLTLGSVVWKARAADTPTADGVKLESLSWDAFKARLGQAKAKQYRYTLVDAWASNCAPCKENFPHLIQMHEKFASKGLQVVSLSLDDTSDAKAVESARAFLREKKATFLNVLLAEEFGIGYEKLDINAIPAVFLYDGDGKLVKRFTMDDPNHQFTYDDVEKTVTALLGASSTSTKTK